MCLCHMDRELSRRRLVQLGAVGALGATAGCVSYLPKELQCKIDGPTTFTFTPTTSIVEMVKNEIEAENEDDEERPDEHDDDEDEVDVDARVEFERNRLVEVLAVRIRIGMEIGVFPQVEAAELRDPATMSFQFDDHTADPNDVEYIVGSNGALTVVIEGDETPETTVFEASGDARRPQAEVRQLEDGTWFAQIPLGPKEREEFQRVLREDIEDEDSYVFITSLHGEQISEANVDRDAIDDITSDDWEHSLSVAGLTRRDAAAVMAHTRSGGLPVDVEMSTSCRDLEFKIDGLPGGDGGMDDGTNETRDDNE